MVIFICPVLPTFEEFYLVLSFHGSKFFAYRRGQRSQQNPTNQRSQTLKHKTNLELRNYERCPMLKRVWVSLIEFHVKISQFLKGAICITGKLNILMARYGTGVNFLIAVKLHLNYLLVVLFFFVHVVRVSHFLWQEQKGIGHDPFFFFFFLFFLFLRANKAIAPEEYPAVTRE